MERSMMEGKDGQGGCREMCVCVCLQKTKKEHKQPVGTAKKAYNFPQLDVPHACVPIPHTCAHVNPQNMQITHQHTVPPAHA